MNLIYALLITLTPVKTIQSQGRVIHLSKLQVCALKSFKVKDIDNALLLKGTMRNNDTADLMIQLINAK